MSPKHLITLKSVRLTDWNNSDTATFLMEREHHKLDLAIIEKVVSQLKLPLEEMGAYQYGTYLHLTTRYSKEPVVYNRNHEKSSTYILSNDSVVDAELELTGDHYLGRIDVKIISLRFVRKYLTD